MWEAQVRASSLAVVTGKNSVAADGTVTPLADPLLPRLIPAILRYAPAAEENRKWALTHRPWAACTPTASP